MRKCSIMKSLCYRLHTARISETMLLKYQLSMAKTAHPRSYSSLTNMSSQIRPSAAPKTLDIAATLTVLHSRIFAYDPGFLGPRHIYLPADSPAPLLFFSSTTSSLRYTNTNTLSRLLVLFAFGLPTLVTLSDSHFASLFWLLASLLLFSFQFSLFSRLGSSHSFNFKHALFQTSSCCPRPLPFSTSPLLVLSWLQLRLFLLACRALSVLLGKTDLHLGLCLSCTNLCSTLESLSTLPTFPTSVPTSFRSMQGSNQLVLQPTSASLLRLSKQNATQLVADLARPLVAVPCRPLVVHLVVDLALEEVLRCRAARLVVAHLELLRPSVSSLVELLEVLDLKSLQSHLLHPDRWPAWAWLLVEQLKASTLWFPMSLLCNSPHLHYQSALLLSSE